MKVLEKSMGAFPDTDFFRLQWVHKTGSWHSISLFTVNRMEIGIQEWRDAIFLRYIKGPLDLPPISMAVAPGYPYLKKKIE